MVFVIFDVPVPLFHLDGMKKQLRIPEIVFRALDKLEIPEILPSHLKMFWEAFHKVPALSVQLASFDYISETHTSTLVYQLM